jgi:hypothetical protein
MALEDDLLADPVGFAKRYSFFPQGKAKDFAFDTDISSMHVHSWLRLRLRRDRSRVERTPETGR